MRKLVSGLTLITILGVSLYLSPLRENTVAIVGVFASLSAVIIALLATTEIEIIGTEEENTAREITSHEILSSTTGPLDFSYTNMPSGKTYSSECQVTLSSHYMPTRAHPVELPLKKRQAKR